MPNDIQKARLLSCYKTEENSLEKGGKVAFIGEIRSFGGREYIKTSDGWKFHGKGTGEKARIHAASSDLTTKIKLSDFSEDTLALYEAVKRGDEAASSLVERLLDNDFPKEDIKQFVEVKFPTQSSYLISYFDLDKVKKEPTFPEKYPGNMPEFKENVFTFKRGDVVSSNRYIITNITDKNIMYEKMRNRFSSRSERISLKDFFQKLDSDSIVYNKLPKLEEAVQKTTTSESDSYKALVKNLKDQTADLKSAFIEKTKTYREEEFDRLINKYGKYTYENWLMKFPGGRFGISKEGESLRKKIGDMKLQGKDKYVRAYIKLAEIHYDSSIEKISHKITEAGFDTSKIKLSSSSIGVNFNTEVTDGSKYMRAYTIIAEGPINAPHYRYLFTSNKQK